MMKTSGSRRISSAMASRSASRMVIVTISVASGTSGSGSATAFGAEGAFFSSPPPGPDAGASALASAGGADPAAFGDQDLAERALIGGLDFHRRLVGFDLGDDIA